VINAADEEVELRRLVGLDSDFHWLIYRVSGSDLASIVASYWGRLLRELYDRVYTSERPTTFAAQHETIIGALATRDRGAARAAMDEHITSGWEAIRVSYEVTDKRSGETE
jgi:DNA-binding GntR family transcriptional regulator